MSREDTKLEPLYPFNQTLERSQKVARSVRERHLQVRRCLGPLESGLLLMAQMRPLYVLLSLQKTLELVEILVALQMTKCEV